MLSRTTESAIHVLLVDDHPVVRMGYLTLLKRFNSAFVFHQASSRAEALDLLARQVPNVALLDLNLSDAVELSSVTELRAKAQNLPILVVSMHDERIYAERALRAGAKGYLMKNQAAHSVTHAVQTVLEGKVWLSEKMRSTLASRQADPSASGDLQKVAMLTDHELEVFRLVGIGLKKAEIALRLGMPNDAIELHRVSIKRKLGMATGAELYRAAFLRFRNDGMSGI
jgi:DNA-binding NarL/FixJ family response regulator